MTPPARLQAAIELLDEIIDAARTAGSAADTLIQRYFQQRRYAGSKDRKAIRELVYRAIRRFGEPPASGRTAMVGLAQGDAELAALFDGSTHAPAALAVGEPAAGGPKLPQWLEKALDPLAGNPDALLERAPLDLRVNLLKSSPEQAMAALPESTPTNLSPIGLRLPDGFRIEDQPAWRSGLVEVQDEGSQLVAQACAVRPGMAVIDLCAGAGGKTLALAAALGNQGRLIAVDVDRRRLSRMTPRLRRAGAETVETILLNPRQERDALTDWRGRADVVLVDAPCSGSGTWRRNPETRWRLTRQRLDALRTLQAHLLDVAAELVAPRGHLVYAVCSVLHEEGRDQSEGFAARHSSFVSEAPPMPGGMLSGEGRLLTPERDGTDGFFIARWRAP